MCLVVLALGVRADYPLILLGNRDEFHRRPTESMHWWPEPRVLAGRDASAGGTWLGVTPGGRVATVTNFRDGEAQRADARSRGGLVPAALEAVDPGVFGDDLAARGALYNGFNLLWGDPSAFYYFSNREGTPHRLEPGFHGLSNGLLDTPWPKLVRVREAVRARLRRPEPPVPEALLEPFMDQRPAADGELPDTGVPRAWERLLSSPFIVSPDYGTRATTAVLVGAQGDVHVSERAFDPRGRLVDDRTFEWTIGEPDTGVP